MAKPANFGREHGRHFAPQSREGRQFERFHSWNYSDKYDEVMATDHQQVHAVDVAVGMIRDALKQHGVADNTVVIFDRSVTWDAKSRPKKKGSR